MSKLMDLYLKAINEGSSLRFDSDKRIDEVRAVNVEEASQTPEQLIEKIHDVNDYNEWKAAVKKHHPDAEIVSHSADSKGNQHTYAMHKTNGQVDKNKIVAHHVEYDDGDSEGRVVIKEEELNVEESEQESESIDEAKKLDRFHIVDQSGNPANLVSYGTLSSAMKDRDEKHPTAKIHLVGPRGKVKHVFEPKSVKEELNLEEFSLEELQDFMMSEDFEQLDELSKDTLNRYIRAANVNKNVHRDHADKLDNASYKGYHTKKSIAATKAAKPSAEYQRIKDRVEDKDKAAIVYHDKKANDRLKGMGKAYRKLKKEETELSEEGPTAGQRFVRAARRPKPEDRIKKLETRYGKLTDHEQGLVHQGLDHMVHNLRNPNGPQLKSAVVRKEELETDLNLEDFSLEELKDFMMSEDFMQLDELSKTTLGNYIKKAASKSIEHARWADKSARAADNEKDIKRSKDLYKVSNVDRKLSNKRQRGIAKAVARLTKEETELAEEMTQAQMNKREDYVKGMKKNYKDFVSKYGTRAKDVMYATATKMAMKEETDLNLEDFSLEELQDFMMSEDFEQLDELSKATLGKYVKKASKIRGLAGMAYASSDMNDKIAARKLDKTQKGIERAIGKLTKEETELNLEDFSIEELQDFMMSEDFEQLDELSKATLDSYIDKATKARQKHSGTSYAADLSDGIRKAKAKAKVKFHNGEDDGHKGVTEDFGPVNEEITYFIEGMISHGDFMDKVDSYKKAGINVVSHKHDGNHAHIVTVDKEGTKRKINFKPSGTSMENLGKVEDGKKPKSAEPEVKRGRGRPAGSKSGARTNGSDKKEYSGLAIHSLNLPKSK